MKYQHIRDTTRTARKPHRCYLCLGEIGKGERYVERFGYSHGKADTVRMHADCEAETRGWDLTDWETFSMGDLERPSKVKQ